MGLLSFFCRLVFSYVSGSAASALQRQVLCCNACEGYCGVHLPAACVQGVGSKSCACNCSSRAGFVCRRMSAKLMEILKAPADFVWISGVTPLSSYSESAAITGAYLLAIYVIQVTCFTSNFSFANEPHSFVAVFHAASRCIRLDCCRCFTQFRPFCIFFGSLCGLHLQVGSYLCSSHPYRLISVLSLHDFLTAGGGSWASLFCESFDLSTQSPPDLSPLKSGNSGALFFWCYVFYLSKYYDFVDTLLLVLRKKELGFLHMYHHASLPLLCVLTMNNWRLPCWTGAIINSGVHVIMYYYFGLRMAFPKKQIWWRKYVTVIQVRPLTLNPKH